MTDNCKNCKKMMRIYSQALKDFVKVVDRTRKKLDQLEEDMK